jgi:hypothetical protein
MYAGRIFRGVSCSRSIPVYACRYAATLLSAAEPLSCSRFPSAERTTAGSSSGSQARRLTVVDANGDAKPDVVGINVVRASLSSRSGEGSFGRAVVRVSGSHRLGSGDQHDSVPDYAVANYEGSVSVLFGTPGGGFTASPRVATGAGTIGVLANDFNRDGKTDLAGVSVRRADVTVMLGNGNGTFLPPIRYRVGGDPWEIAAADLNGDGNLDILANGAPG